jgi:anti-anti-sigma regulatory factor
MEAIVYVRIDALNGLALIECEGRISTREDALRLRYAVMSRQAPVILIDMTEVTAVEGQGLEMLIFLRSWTAAHNIRLRLYNPSPSVKAKLQQANYVSDSQFATLDEMIGLVCGSVTPLAAAA